MARMGFHDMWIRMVMNCVTTVSFTVLVNGKPGSSFKPSRGLRQGDPLSPYLFLLVCDVLSRNVRAAVTSGKLENIRISKRCPGISHLFFADDSLFFSKATSTNCFELLRIIDEYCHASGQSLNTEKSATCFSTSTPVTTKATIAGIFRIPITDNPGTYLGIPSSWGKKKNHNLLPMFGKG